MAKKKTNYPISRDMLILILWFVGLVPLILYQVSGFLDVNQTIVIILILASYVLVPIIPLTMPGVKRSIKTLPISALISLFLSAILSIDFWSEIVHEDICGSGFSGGNCFLADGLGVMIYMPFIPILIFYTNIVLTKFIVKNMSSGHK